MFVVRTSHPHLITIKEPRLEVEVRLLVEPPARVLLTAVMPQGKAKSFIRFRVAAVPTKRVEDVYLFINDSQEQNEDCLLVSLQFE